MGGVAHKPWRALDAEHQLAGADLSDDTFAAAGEAAVKGAQGRGHNDFKVVLAARTVARALTEAAAQKKA
jgi:xanthine dehydrogenase YagS FAD-binding subunit